MKRTRVILIALAVFGILLVCSHVFGEETKEAEKTFAPLLDATTEPTTRYQPVTFDSHDSHGTEYKVTCKQCHHKMKKEGKLPI